MGFTTSKDSVFIFLQTRQEHDEREKMRIYIPFMRYFRNPEPQAPESADQNLEVCNVVKLDW